MDTIFAVSSGAAPAAISILRISGPQALAAARLLSGTLPAPRVAGLRALRDPATGTLLDRGLVLVFPGPDSATGEDIVELHIHGGRATQRALEAALGTIAGLRQAEPGEFTRRALEHGRIDLTEAEGLGDLLSAETEHQRRAALRLSEGGLRQQIERWNDRLVEVAASIEAALDFSDEDDVPEAVTAESASVLAALADEIGAVVAAPSVERLRDGVRVVIAGPPNSGKSTLINRLAGRDAAIVSPTAGTTRDRIEVSVMRSGVAYLLVDTAGLRDDGADEIERIGIGRAIDAIAAGDIVLWLDDVAPPYPSAMWLHARCDIPRRASLPPGPDLAISAASGEGISALWSLLEERAGRLWVGADEMAINARQRALLTSAEAVLRDGVAETDILLRAEAIRSARAAFDSVTGRADVEAVLDALFGRFCIGK
ncbi:tRNA uridine-5-carboxymethylaminomethyl(34) synthesis GTPase MnmE [Sphingomonas sp. NFR15]|uniref:tRNA uridine-5-carboxymethylaminomethyl(34) synthesis GTPase MnmE n=1 Tax=Sphingomonas sp. NFR15 TaxID=1566282 RepID=UPI0008862D00|nr:tRNA uridine-5-carboxymethylaminomethyl(34) synthesis GTPase MnmE [Sphingomonas sp. NFR15]SDA33208.1 tRNA modification GTPase [Sphingomonas sp. NFR15]